MDLEAERGMGWPERVVAGLDEVGRGPWAGPVVAAAVVLAPGAVPEGLADSKRLSAARREGLARAILGAARVGIGAASCREIDRLNILRASDLAMRRALAALRRQGVTPAAALIDGHRVPPGLDCPAEAIVKGDGSVASIAAASIVAKVTRDRLMARLARRWPGYGWERNAGYGTAEHRRALETLGPTPHHRVSFRPVHNILCEESRSSR